MIPSRRLLSLLVLACFVPLPVASQWVQTPFPPAVNVTSLASEGFYTFAGTDNAGVFRTSDNGVHWSAVNNGITSLGTTSLAVSGTLIFAGTDDGSVFVSGNDGTNWSKPVGPGGLVTGGPIQCLTVVSGRVFAGVGTDAGGKGAALFVSTDAGSSWQSCLQGDVRSLGSAHDLLLAGMVDSLRISSDGGSTWSTACNGLGLFAGHVVSIASKGNIIYAGTGGGGIFRSTDFGKHWSGPSSGPGAISVWCLKVDSSDVYAGADEGKVYRSTDDGLTWVLSKSGMPGDRANALVGAAGCLFVGSSENGVSRSCDRGATWAPANVGFPGPTFFTVVATGMNRIFAGTKGYGLFVSTDAGNQWKAVRWDAMNPDVYSLVTQGANVYAASSAGLFVSSDSGGSWIKSANNGLPSIARALAVTVSTLFAGTTAGVYVSTDNGQTWAARDPALNTENARQLLAIDDTVYVGCQSGHIFKSTNLGFTWDARDALGDGIVAMARTRDKLFVGTSASGLFMTTNDGVSWNRVTMVNSSVVTSLFAAGMISLCGTTDGTWASTDGGAVWYDANSGLGTANVNSFAVKDDRVFAAGSSGLWFRPRADIIEQQIPMFDFFPISKWTSWTYQVTQYYGESYMSTQSGWYRSDTGLVHISVDSCQETETSHVWFMKERDSLRETWRVYSKYGYPPDTTYVVGYDSTLLFSLEEYKDPLHRLVSYPQGGFNSQSLRIFAFPRPLLYSKCFPVDFNIYRYIRDSVQERQFVFCTNDYVYMTTAHDTMLFIKGVGLGLIHHGAMYSGGHTLFWSENMQATLLQTTTGVTQNAHVKTNFHLWQNYPNPFNPGSEIRFQISEFSNVRLVVYDILGREVAVLVNEKKAPGSYEVRFDGSGLASGVYIYRLTAGNYVEARRMVLVK